MDSHSEIFNGFSALSVTTICITIVLLLISAFFAAFEVAFFSLENQDWNKMDDSKKSHKYLLDLHTKPELLLATTLICNTLLNIAIIILGSYSFSLILNISFIGSWISFLIQALSLSFLILFATEIFPRIYQSEDLRTYALRLVGVFVFVQKLLSPLSQFFVNSSNLINKRLLKYNQPSLSMDEISHALKLSAKENDEDTEILEGIVNFSSTDVNKVMTSRLDMVDIEIKTLYKKVLEIIIESGYSRIPVYQANKDNIKGILYIKDLLPHLDKPEHYHWQSHIRPAYFVPETKKIVDLLEDFQKKKIHIAIVVDEFGGTSGMVTMEDILEEIVGDISDEYDTEDALYSQIDENTYIFEAKIMLNDFFRIKGIDETEFEDLSADIETLAGLLLELKGEIPVTNEHILYKNFDFEILKADMRRIEKIKLTINNEPTNE